MLTHFYALFYGTLVLTNRAIVLIVYPFWTQTRTSMKRLFFLFAALGMAGIAPAQHCWYNHVQNSSFTNNGTLYTYMASQVPNWHAYAGTADIYPDGSIFMFGSNGPAEVIEQDLCEPLEMGKTYRIAFDARTSNRKDGAFVVDLSGAASGIQTVFDSGNITHDSMPLLTFTGTFTALDTFTKVRVYPRGMGGIMDMVVDNVRIEEEVGTGTFTMITDAACESMVTLNTSDPNAPYGSIHWYLSPDTIPFDSGTVTTATASLLSTTYVAVKRFAGCSDTCVARDTIVVQCLDEPSGFADAPQGAAGIRSIVPNPVGNEAQVAYALPPGTQQATLLITDLHGRVIQHTALDRNASGRVYLEVSPLPQGVYLCTLSADGAVIDTQRLCRVW